jgi:hypothetical protein
MHGDAATEDTAAMAARRDGRDRDIADVERRKGTSMGSDRGIKVSKSVADKPEVSTNGIPKQCKYNRRSMGSLRIVHMEWSKVEPSIVGPEKAKMTAIAAFLSVGGVWFGSNVADASAKRRAEEAFSSNAGSGRVKE